MRKVITSLGIILMLCLMIYPMEKIDVRKRIKKEVNSVYFITSNENHLYDQPYIQRGEGETASYQYLDITFYNQALPMNVELETVQSASSMIEKIVPFYPMHIKRLALDEDPITIKVYQDNKVKEKTLPNFTITSGMIVNNYVSGIDITSYTDEEIFLNDATIYKEFESDSGIYLSNQIYRGLKLTGTKNNLAIEATVRIPVATHLTNELFPESEDFYVDCYETSQYAKVKHTFEIAGIIDYGSGIYIPYETANQIYQNINQADYSLKEDETYWQPNTWMIECNENVNVDSLGNDLKSVLDSFMLSEYYSEVSGLDLEGRKIFE